MRKDHGVKSSFFDIVKIGVLYIVLPVKPLWPRKQAKLQQVVQDVKGPWLKELAKVQVGLSHLHSKVQKDLDEALTPTKKKDSEAFNNFISCTELIEALTTRLNLVYSN